MNRLPSRAAPSRAAVVRHVVLLALLAMAASRARAHHGSEFTVLEDFDIGHLWEGHLLGVLDLERTGSDNAWSSEGTAFVSPAPRLGAGLDFRFAEDPGGGWSFGSVTPRLHLQLTDPASTSPIRFAVTLGYQFAQDLRRTTTVTTIDRRTFTLDEPRARSVVTTTPAPPDPGDAEPPCDPLYDLDCPDPEPADPSPAGSIRRKHKGHPTESQSTTTTRRASAGGTSRRRTVTETTETTTTTTEGGHRGIHNHDADQWVARLVAQTEWGGTEIVANVIATLPEGDRVYWGFGIGARRRVLERTAITLEGIGDVHPGREREIVASIAHDLNDRTTVRVGAGIGLTDASPDTTMRAGILWRF